MNILANAFVAAGLCSVFDAEVVHMSMSQLKTRRNKVIRNSIAVRGANYNRSVNGQFRSVTSEQNELQAINKAIRSRQHITI